MIYWKIHFQWVIRTSRFVWIRSTHWILSCWERNESFQWISKVRSAKGFVFHTSRVVRVTPPRCSLSTGWSSSSVSFVRCCWSVAEHCWLFPGSQSSQVIWWRHHTDDGQGQFSSSGRCSGEEPAVLSGTMAITGGAVFSEELKNSSSLQFKSLAFDFQQLVRSQLLFWHNSAFILKVS